MLEGKCINWIVVGVFFCANCHYKLFNNMKIKQKKSCATCHSANVLLFSWQIKYLPFVELNWKCNENHWNVYLLYWIIGLKLFFKVVLIAFLSIFIAFPVFLELLSYLTPIYSKSVVSVQCIGHYSFFSSKATTHLVFYIFIFWCFFQNCLFC